MTWGVPSNDLVIIEEVKQSLQAQSNITIIVTKSQHLHMIYDDNDDEDDNENNDDNVYCVYPL